MKPKHIPWIIILLIALIAKCVSTNKKSDDSYTAEEQKVTIVPFFRAPSSDLNLTLSLALMTMVLVEVFGLWEHGFGYLGHFIRFKGFARQGFWLGLIDFFVGLIELVSEFFKIVSFSFRLFGNIFAGEVVLIVILSLVSFLLRRVLSSPPVTLSLPKKNWHRA